MINQPKLRFNDRRRREKVEEIRQELHRRAFFRSGHEDLQRAADNDVEAVKSLTLAYDGWHVGLFVKWVYLMGLSEECLRAALSSAWLRRHSEVQRAARTRPELIKWFRAANFDLSMLPDEVTVWRGTCGIPWEEALCGWSWTTRRSVAAWFAMRFPHFGSPIVLRRTVKRSEILYFSDSREESECVLSTIGEFQFDGTPDEWRRLAKEEIAQRRANRLVRAA
ncbi:MAG TPA: hypothetical protein VHL31_07705 [Geminicoccus sp.]|uniref:hypothetical protein n=1 Tax=Geminicoccus sp. TaxID=2024832 RepID=UPI002E34A18C|nr:hypothetical protein [Geminicoccus sp.]HEX2526172.1 hypothetical protein [Geminicoccus sp.]